MMQTRGGTSRRDQNPYLWLEGGVVSVNEIKFKHTPKHMKKLNVVKLGARVVDQPEVIEAVTEPFTVKDKRSKSKKRYPPSPTDDVWRLEHIYKNGAFHKRLTENGIKTVEDFLIELQNNPERLHQILGKSMSENNWIKVTTHAKTCNVVGLVNLVTVDECQSLEFQNPSGTTETNRWIDDTAECSTSYVIADQSDEMSVAITSPGHSVLGTWEYLESLNCLTSAISQSEDLEKIIQLINSNAIHYDDISYRELGHTNNFAAETDATQFHGLQHGERMDLSQNQFMISENVHTFITEDGTNTNQQRQMVPEASDKYKKSWIKISSILKWLELKRFVKLKKLRMTKKRKLISK